MGDTMSGKPLSGDRWAKIGVPVLVMHGIDTMPFLIAGAKAAAEHLPTANLLAVPGEQHSAAPDVLAPVLRQLVRD